MSKGAARGGLFSAVLAAVKAWSFVLRFSEQKRRPAGVRIEATVWSAMRWAGDEWGRHPNHATTRRLSYLNSPAGIRSISNSYGCE